MQKKIKLKCKTSVYQDTSFEAFLNQGKADIFKTSDIS